MTAAEEEEAWVTARRTIPTGQCPVCGRTFRLRKNGTIWNHRKPRPAGHWSGYSMPACPGAGQKSKETP